MAVISGGVVKCHLNRRRNTYTCRSHALPGEEGSRLVACLMLIGEEGSGEEGLGRRV